MEHLSFPHFNFERICVPNWLFQVFPMADPLLGEDDDDENEDEDGILRDILAGTSVDWWS